MVTVVEVSVQDTAVVSATVKPRQSGEGRTRSKVPEKHLCGVTRNILKMRSAPISTRASGGLRLETPLITKHFYKFQIVTSLFHLPPGITISSLNWSLDNSKSM